MESGTPEKEVRLRHVTYFMGYKESKHQRAFFEKLDKDWRDKLIQDLVTYHPIEAAAFLRGVDVVLPNDTKSGSDASSKNEAAKPESTTSPKPSNSESPQSHPALPAPASLAVQAPEPTSKGPTEEDYLEGAFGY